jgi:hypothetical protein
MLVFDAGEWPKLILKLIDSLLASWETRYKVNILFFITPAASNHVLKVAVEQETKSIN